MQQSLDGSKGLYRKTFVLFLFSQSCDFSHYLATNIFLKMCVPIILSFLTNHTFGVKSQNRQNFLNIISAYLGKQLSTNWFSRKTAIFSPKMVTITLTPALVAKNCWNRNQGCQIFLGTWYQNWKKWTKRTRNVPNGHKISQISIKYSEWP
jgi:hypothetical protein